MQRRHGCQVWWYKRILGEYLVLAPPRIQNEAWYSRQFLEIPRALHLTDPFGRRLISPIGPILSQLAAAAAALRASRDIAEQACDILCRGSSRPSARDNRPAFPAR